MFNIKRIFLIQLVILAIMIIPLTVSAQGQTPPPEGGGTPPPSSVSLKLDPPLKDNISSLEDFIKAILNDIVLPIGAVVVVIFIIYSGFLFVTAQGNETKLEKAKSTFLWTVIGAAVLLGSWAVSQVIKTTIDQLRGTASVISHYLG